MNKQQKKTLSYLFQEWKTLTQGISILESRICVRCFKQPIIKKKNAWDKKLFFCVVEG